MISLGHFTFSKGCTMLSHFPISSSRIPCPEEAARKIVPVSVLAERDHWFKE